MDLEKIKAELLKGKTIEDVLGKLNWKEFEEAVAEIFKENEFFVVKNFRFKTDRKYEIDLIARRGFVILCADCKQWCKGRYKKTGLRQAALEQEKRVEEFEKFLEKSLTIRKSLGVKKGDNFYPIIITLFEEEVLKEGRTFVVPVWKLNNFLLNLEEYLHP
jgi:Holliday junction resolvase-like predicted endonuclease